MQDKELDKIMDAWVDHEVESAPRMKPTGEMYQLVRAKQKKLPVFRLRSPWAAMGAAVASLMLVLYVVRFHTSIFHVAQPGQTVAWVGQRTRFDTKRGPVIEPSHPPEKGPGKGQVSFGQIVFHIGRLNAQSVQTIDLQTQHEEAVTLTVADNYRLFMIPGRDWYVYVFQMSPSGSLIKLFPDETFSSVQNPLEQEQTYYLPSEPNWFYLTDDTDLPSGEGQLYVIASERPLEALVESYNQYTLAEDESEKQTMLEGLIEVIDDKDPGQAYLWKLVLRHP
jgi:hypothetical protein